MVKFAKIVQYILVGIVCLYALIGIFLIAVYLLSDPSDISFLFDVIKDEGKFILGFGLLAILAKVLRTYLEKNKK